MFGNLSNGSLKKTVLSPPSGLMTQVAQYYVKMRSIDNAFE